MTVDRRKVLAGLAVSLVPLDRALALDQPITLVAGDGKLRLQGKTDTAVWAYNGQVPGPLLRVKKGDAVTVELVNKLTQPTSLCWHGVRIANAMDGVAGLTQTPVMPGETFAYHFVPPDSGTYWYHPHVWPHSAEQIGRGLYGVLIVDEPDPPPVDDDLLVVLDDWTLDDHGQIQGSFLDATEARGGGRIGSLLTVNAKAVPDSRTVRPGARVRVRLLNACSARIAVVGFVGLHPTIIAIDGQPSESFEPAGDMVPIGPGARFDLLVDVPTAASLVLRGDGASDQPLLTFAIAGARIPARGPVAKQRDNPLLPTRIALEKSLKRTLVIANRDIAGAPKPATESRPAPMFWTLDGTASDGFSGKPLFAVREGSPVTLAFVNKTAEAQQMHVHGHVFRLLHDLDDGWDPYWRESVLLAPGKTKHVAFVADNPGRWAIESLTLDRQVTGLAGYFLVEPAEERKRSDRSPAAATKAARRR